MQWQTFLWWLLLLMMISVLVVSLCLSLQQLMSSLSPQLPALAPSSKVISLLQLTSSPGKMLSPPLSQAPFAWLLCLARACARADWGYPAAVVVVTSWLVIVISLRLFSRSRSPFPLPSCPAH